MEKLEKFNEIDQLYAELCNTLRKTGKASSFCQLIKNAPSDLNRINILNKDCNIVPSLIKTVKKCRKSNYKDPQHARKLLETYYIKTRSCGAITESENLIQILNSALVHLQLDEHFDVKQFDKFDENNGIKALENLLVDIDDDRFCSDENVLLSEIYKERANCFYDLGDHKMTILESLRALHYAKFNKNNPREDLFLLLFRISASLKNLRESQSATNVIQFSIRLLRSSHLDNATKSVETMKLVKLLKDIQIGTKEAGDNRSNAFTLDSSLSKIFPSTSDTLANTSSSLQLKWHENRGRHLIATETIPAGSTLIIEDPFSWIIHPDHSHSFCQNCCLEVRNLIPCKKCPNVVFCSEQCRKTSQPYHQYECEFMKMLTSSEILGNMALLCYRTITKNDCDLNVSHIRNYIQLAEVRNDSPENEQFFRDKFLLGLNEHLKLDSSDYGAVFAQTPNTEKRLGGDLLKRTFSAILLTICLRLTGYFGSDELFDSDCLTEREELIASLYLRHLQSTSCNAYGINKVNGVDPRRLQVIEIGGATYPIISTTNHSCNSNVYRFSIGKICVVKSLREICCGEEILDSYGPHFASNSIEERNQDLNGQYLFTCSCSPCVENWLLYSQLPRENPSIKCTKCGNGLCTKKKDKYICSECMNVLDARNYSITFTECLKHYEAAKEALLNPKKDLKINYENIHDSIVAYAKTLGTTQKWPCQVLIECEETLKLCWNLQNSCFNFKNEEMN